MAEPNNTPIPASTPRSGSPSSHHRSPFPVHGFSLSAFTPISPPRDHRLASAAPALRKSAASPPPQRTILVLAGSHAAPEEGLSRRFDVVQPGIESRSHDGLLTALERRTWGQFYAVWDQGDAEHDHDDNNGAPLRSWDDELVKELPRSVEYFVGKRGRVDPKLLEDRGIEYVELRDQQTDGATGIEEAMRRISVRDGKGNDYGDEHDHE